MDVRAPIEFERGAFPCALNLPLLDDEQRHQIGCRYKEQGEEAAIALGLELATDDIRQLRLDAWREFYNKHPEAYLYCFRGGLRSRTTQSWLAQSGIHFPLITGGYKVMRRFLIDALESTVERSSPILVSGLTGSGKTRLLLEIDNHIDLEGLANHRGSAFGRDPLDFQPSQIDFENNLSIAFLKLRHRKATAEVFIEDEGRRIGRLSIPRSLFDKMRNSPRAILEESIENRTQLIREDYITAAWPDYQTVYGDDAEQVFSQFVLDNLQRIKKRLGGERFETVFRSFSKALKQLFTEADESGFDEGIRILLKDYYDPMYEYQLDGKKPEILFRGNRDDYLEWVLKRSKC